MQRSSKHWGRAWGAFMGRLLGSGGPSGGPWMGGPVELGAALRAQVSLPESGRGIRPVAPGVSVGQIACASRGRLPRPAGLGLVRVASGPVWGEGDTMRHAPLMPIPRFMPVSVSTSLSTSPSTLISTAVRAVCLALGLVTGSSLAASNQFCGGPVLQTGDPSDLAHVVGDQTLEALAEQPASMM